MKEIKKIYISLPISGREETLFERIDKAKEYIERLNTQNELNTPYSKYTFVPVVPVDCESFETYMDIKNANNDYSYYMGEDIKSLMKCDAIFMCEGWNNSKGCRAELEFAKVYDKIVIYELY